MSDQTGRSGRHDKRGEPLAGGRVTEADALDDGEERAHNHERERHDIRDNLEPPGQGEALLDAMTSLVKSLLVHHDQRRTRKKVGQFT